MSNHLYTRQRNEVLHHPLFQWPGLQAWSFYFLIKIVLAYTNYIELNLLWNAFLVAFLVVPAPYLLVKVLRQIVAIPAAVALLYSESFLPPFERLTAQWHLVSGFSWDYLLELALRAVKVEAIAAFLVAWILYMYLAKILRMTAIVLILLISFPWLHDNSGSLQAAEELAATTNTQTQRATGQGQQNTAGNNVSKNAELQPEQALQAFYQTQQQIMLQPSASNPDFDILMVNICSLSWQDLADTDLLDHPLLARGDIRFDNFYSASSYSGPATLRLLQASCGHKPHGEIFSAPQQCMVGNQLANLGYDTEVRLNHNGVFDNYINQLRNLGGLSEAQIVPAEKFPTVMRGFDQSEIKSDAAVLRDWLTADRQAPTYTFYNSISLHDGNRVLEFKGSSLESYRLRLKTLLDELNATFDAIERSGRKALVVIIPEHGAGLKGDKFQLPGMREIPTPALTHVPVIFKLFGLASEPGVANSMHVVEQDTGPQSITEVIYQIIDQQPFNGGDYRPAEITKAITPVMPVLENEGVRMIKVNGQFYLQINDGAWRPYNG